MIVLDSEKQNSLFSKLYGEYRKTHIYGYHDEFKKWLEMIAPSSKCEVSARCSYYVYTLTFEDEAYTKFKLEWY